KRSTSHAIPPYKNPQTNFDTKSLACTTNIFSHTCSKSLQMLPRSSQKNLPGLDVASSRQNPIKKVKNANFSFSTYYDIIRRDSTHFFLQKCCFCKKF